jgi:hypothetical protein
MTARDLTGIELMVLQYEDRIAFERANPFSADVVARAVPYCFIPSGVRSRIEDGQADLITELGKLLAAARKAVR